MNNKQIIFSNSRDILKFNRSADLRGLDVDTTNGMIYWSDVSKYMISRQRMDSSGRVEVLHDFGFKKEVNFLAVEWVSGLLYWSDSTHNLIEVSNLNGSFKKTLFDKGLKKVYGIAVAPKQG